VADPILDIRGVTKMYGSTVANDGVDFQVEPGRILSLIHISEPTRPY